jgi:uncharacterized membrane protein YraQ (UPF0718 family)
VPHLGLPGNPVSSLVSFELFARPALLRMQGAATLDKFTWGAKLAFLTFGPMMDVKLIFLYQTVMRKNFIIALAVALFLAIGGITVFWQHLVFQVK